MFALGSVSFPRFFDHAADAEESTWPNWPRKHIVLMYWSFTAVDLVLTRATVVTLKSQ